MSGSFDSLLSRRGLSLDRLHVLLQVAEAGSIAKAAGNDVVRQSQFSRQLKELAEFFGVELTRREGKFLTLTQAGQRLAHIVREHLTALLDFEAACQRKPVEISIGAGNSVIQWLVLPRLHALQNAFPSVTVSLQNMPTHDVIDGIRDMRLDFGIVRSDARPKVVGKHRLGRMEYALFVPQTLAGQPKTDDLASLLAELPLVSLNSSGELTRQFASVTAKLRIVPNVKLECNSLTQAFQAVQGGEYAAVLPTLVKPLADSLGIRVIGSKAFAGMSRNMDLIWNHRVERVRPLIAEIAGHAGKNWRF